MATNTSIFSPTTTIHHCFSDPAAHCPPSTRNLALKSTGFKCKAVSNSRIQDAEYSDTLQQKRLPLINPHNGNMMNNEDTEKIVYPSNKITQFVDIIKTMLGSMDDGEISVSAYDTAWVALVQDVNGSGGPQFPSSLEWIVNNQLPDGSWGYRFIFSAHDRLMNTLACVIALTSWNVHPTKCQQGLKFLKENISKLDDEYGERMPIGFEVAFPSLTNMAHKLKIDVREDTPAMKEIYARRNLKITKQVL